MTATGSSEAPRMPGHSLSDMRYADREENRGNESSEQSKQEPEYEQVSS